MGIKRYIPYFTEARRQSTFKAWFNPESNWSVVFNPNMIHDEIAYEKLHMDEDSALKKGYYRMYIYKNTINIDSYEVPDDRQFSATKEFIIDHVFPAKISSAIWEVERIGKYFKFNKQSFLYADSVK